MYGLSWDITSLLCIHATQQITMHMRQSLGTTTVDAGSVSALASPYMYSIQSKNTDSAIETYISVMWGRGEKTAIAGIQSYKKYGSLH